MLSIVYPAAIVQAAFDQERALAEISDAICRRDDARGLYNTAVIEIGRQLIEARRAMPGEVGPGGTERYSQAFLAFVERCGFGINVAVRYMGYARDPRRLTLDRLKKQARFKTRRQRILMEVREMLAEASDKDAALRVIDEEIRELAS